MSLSSKEIAQAILDNIGGNSNISDLKMCSTRLCFTLKNASLVREENIKRLNSIIGIIEADNKYYIIPQAGLTLRIFNEITSQIGPRNQKLAKKSLIDRIKAVFSKNAKHTF